MENIYVSISINEFLTSNILAKICLHEILKNKYKFGFTFSLTFLKIRLFEKENVEICLHSKIRWTVF